ncbi:DUF5811 family protein [Halobacteria archaeon HArc-gm2]|nr:DUF5811 family protein [Halobacteria archaeon HArc-gm2]
MYGNSPLGAEPETVSLTAEQRQLLRQDLSTMAARMRDVLPAEFVVGSEITNDDAGVRATIAVQPPMGAVVSANFTPESDDARIDDDELDDLVHGLAASAALQVKNAMGGDAPAVAQ